MIDEKRAAVHLSDAVSLAAGLALLLVSQFLHRLPPYRQQQLISAYAGRDMFC